MAGGLVAFTLIFAAFLWYAQFYAYYNEVEGLTEVSVEGHNIEVSNYHGLDGSSSGLKLRGCFVVDPADFANVAVAVAPVPTTPPGWFDCFQTEQLTNDVNNGVAIAYMAAQEDMDGLDRLIAVYPDGRAFMWRQLNDKYQE